MPSKQITPIRREVFADQVADGLRDLIIQGAYEPGQRLVEEVLASQFGVSRGPIRDSLKRLEVEGLVEFRQPGVYVIGIGARDIDELYTLREALETTALRLAMTRSPAPTWQAMLEAVQDMEEAAKTKMPAEFSAADVRFHSHIYEASAHRRLNDVWKQYLPVLSGLLRRTVYTDQDHRHTAQNHRELYELIVAGKDEEAETRLRAHLSESHARMIEAHDLSGVEAQSANA